MSQVRDTGRPPSTISAPRFGRLPLDRPKPFVGRLGALPLPLIIVAILAISATSLGVAIWLLTLHWISK